MKYLNIIVEGNTEENFVNDVMKPHFAQLDIYVSARKILTGWDKINAKPAKGGLLKYDALRRDVFNWINSDKNREDIIYTTFVDLYAFPKGALSPYSEVIQNISDPYHKILALEDAIMEDIDHPNFIPYVQLHEFEAFLMVDPDKMLTMYPDKGTSIRRLKASIAGKDPEKINESPQTAPSKRIIQFIPEYEGSKAQVGALVAEEIGITKLREKCPHFNEWITKLESLA